MNRWSRVLAGCSLALLSGMPAKALADPLSSMPDEAALATYQRLLPQCAPDHCPAALAPAGVPRAIDRLRELAVDEPPPQADAEQARQHFYRRLVLLMSIAGR